MDRLSVVALEMARRPRPGRVKTRLARTEGDVEAARIYTVLARDVHATLKRLQTDGRLSIALCLPDEDTADPWLAGADRVWPQGDGDLGARLARLFRRAFEGGADRVFAIGTDVAGLDAARIEDAVYRLRFGDVVAAPTPDGGYALIGVRREAATRALPALFDDVPWSTDAVMATTRRRLDAAGL